MTRSLTQMLVLSTALACAAGACASKKPAPRGAAPATAAAGPLPPGPGSRAGGLPIPSLDVEWTPPMVTAGDIEGLQEVLGARTKVGVMLGGRLWGADWSRRAQALVTALAPKTQVVERGQGVLSGLLDTQGVLPADRASVDAAGGPHRPSYAIKELQLGSQWKQRVPALGAANTMLAIDDAELDMPRWRALQAYAVGSCDAALRELAAGQERSLTELEPFLDHADAVLWQVYRAALRTLLPGLEAELEPYARLKTRAQFEDNAAWEQYRCGHGYWEYLQNFSRCGDEVSTCPSAPRLFLIDGARIGTAEPTFYLPETCPARVGRDFVGEARQLAREAAQVAGEHLSRDWVALADRLGMITEIHATLEDVCTPRRRRFSDADVQEARARLERIGAALRADEPARDVATWVVEDDQFHVPGLGGVHQVARFDAGPGSAAQRVVRDARGLREFLLGRAMCRSGYSELPLAVMVVDVPSSAVSYLGYFYEEELFCADLPPLTGPGGGPMELPVAAGDG